MIANARSVFLSHMQIGVPVAVKGVGFFDSNTLTSNVAPNKVELHPVLDINFSPGSPPPSNDFTMSATPSPLSVPQGQSATSAIGTQVTAGSSQSVSLRQQASPAA